MAITNPRKKFNFRVTILPAPQIPVFGVQKVTTPDSTIEVVPHGFGNTQINTAGQIKAGTLTMERIIDQSEGLIAAAMFAWHWAAQNPASQVGGDPLGYKRLIKVEELGTVGNALAVINTWYAVGAWPSAMNGRDFDRMSSDNVVESIEFAIDYITLDLPPEGIIVPVTVLGGAGNPA